MQAEKDFLSNYNIEDYERPSVTADIVAFMIRTEEEESFRKEPKSKLSVLLINRGEHPFKGCWALPGGFLKMNETIEECAVREIVEETSVTPTALVPIGVFSAVKRDPRGRIISNAFACIISEESIQAVGGYDAADARWVDVWFERGRDGKYHLDLYEEGIQMNAVLEEEKIKLGRTQFKIIDSGNLAFDHAEIIATALSELRKYAKNFEAIFDFLPEKFTLTSLQRVQETIMNISVLPANFRRKVADYVVETDEYTAGAGHRPAKLYRRK